MARVRTGEWSLQYYALKLCKVLAWATPYITKKFPDNGPLQAALAAASAACVILNAELELVREIGD